MGGIRERPAVGCGPMYEELRENIYRIDRYLCNLMGQIVDIDI